MPAKTGKPSLNAIATIDATRDAADIAQAMPQSGGDKEAGLDALRQAVGTMAPDEIKSVLQENGLTLQRMRSDNSRVTSEDRRVAGKGRLGLHIDVDVLKGVKEASHATNTKVSHIMEEAAREWLTARGYRIT